MTRHHQTTIMDSEVGVFNVPRWVNSLKSFRRWTDIDDELDFGRVYYLKGDIVIDMSREQLYTHNLVKTQLAMVLGRYVEDHDLGLYFGDGVLLSNIPADLSKQPDGIFVSHQSFADGRVQDVPSRVNGGYTELEGAPDLVIEVVSRSSVRKDTRDLRLAYWEADVPEYWLIDARGDVVKFDALRSSARGYVSVSKKGGGWVRSVALGAEFRLSRREDDRGRPRFTLEVRRTG